MKVAGTFALSVAILLLASSTAMAGADISEIEGATYESDEEKNKAVTEVSKSTEDTENKEEDEISLEDNVLNVQERLAVLGYYPTYRIDGVHNDLMKPSIKRFQKDYGLDANGVFNEETAVMLNDYTGMHEMVPVYPSITVYYYAAPGYYAN